MEFYKDFYFNGEYASSLGYMAVKPSSDDGDLGLSRELVSTELTPYKNTKDILGTKYADSLSIKFFIVKDPCTNNSQQEMVMERGELREVLAWLTSSHSARKLELYSDVDIGYYGVFTDIEPYVYDNFYGFTATFKTNAPYGFQINKESFKVVGGGTLKKTILNNSDELEDYVYPKVTITSAVIGDYSIKNKSDNNNVFNFTLKDSFSEVYIDCGKQYIIADGSILTLDDIGWDVNELYDWNDVATNIYKLYWLRFLSGNNELEISGEGDYLVEFHSPVKTGGY